MAEAKVPRGWLSVIRKMIRDEIAAYARSAPLRNATISGGRGLSILDGGTLRIMYPTAEGGEAAVYYGRLVSTVDGSYLGTGMLVQDPDGTDIASFSWDAVNGGHTAHLHDAQNNIIVGNDKLSGQGLARPYVGGGFARARYSDWSVSTTSAEWETLWETPVWKQHPRLQVAVRASMDTADTTGEVRVLVDDVQLGATSAEGFATSYSYFGPEPIAGEHMETVLVKIQGRRTSATGALRVEPRYWMGLQS